jgi:hypothetical protein
MKRVLLPALLLVAVLWALGAVRCPHGLFDTGCAPAQPRPCWYRPHAGDLIFDQPQSSKTAKVGQLVRSRREQPDGRE